MSFDKIDIASRFVNVMKQSARKEVLEINPRPLIGRMISVDIAGKNGKCWITGDQNPVTVNLSQNTVPGKWDDKDQPNSTLSTSTVGAGSIVVLASFNGSLYVTDVLNGGQMAVDLQIVNHTLVMQGAAGETYVGGGTDESNNPVDSLGQFTYSNAGFASFTGIAAGEALMFGPYTPFVDGAGTWFDMGTWRMTVFTTDYNLHYATKTFEFNISPYMMFADDGFYTADTHFDRWFRLLPKSSITNDYDAEASVKNGDFDIDIAMRKTSWGIDIGGNQSWELWLRAIPRATDISTTYREWWTSIQTDVFHQSRSLRVDGRFQQERVASPPAVKGYLGFHNAHHIFHDSGRSSTKTNYFTGVLADTGPWRTGELRTAQDIQKTWTANGIFTIDGSDNFKWTGNIEVWGVGRHRNGLTAGKATVACPTSGTIPVMGINNTTVTASASGIPLSSGRSLWFGLPPGQGDSNLAGFLFLVDGINGSPGDYLLPEWAVLIAARGPLNTIPEVRLGNGASVDKWRSVSFVNSWVDFGSGFTTAQYRMMPGGLVVMKGLVKNGSANTMFTLPAGFRPAEQTIFPMILNNGADIVGRLDVNTNGNVDRVTAGNSWVSLNSIRFFAEQ